MKPLSRDARRIVDAARGAEEPSDADRARIRKKLLLRAGALAAASTTAAASGVSAASGAAASASTASAVVATGAAASSAAAVTAASSGAAVTAASAAGSLAGLGGLLMKIGTAAVLAGALSGGAVMALRDDGRAPDAPREAVAGAVTRAPRDAASSAAIAGARPASPAPTPSSTASTAPVVPTAPVAKSLAGAPSPGEPLVGSAVASPRARPARATGMDAPAAGASEAGGTLPGEIALLQRAQGAMGQGSPGRALELLDQHAAEYARGAMREERTAARVFALCALGRTAEARAEAARFLAAAPRSPLAERVRTACSQGADAP